MSSASSTQSPTEQGAFSVSSRLLSCLVTESLLRAFYLPSNKSQRAITPVVSGILVILSPNLISEEPVISRVLHADDVFAIVPLHHPPVFREGSSDEHGRLVGLLDPLDMLPEVFDLIEPTSISDKSSDNSQHDDLRSLVLFNLAPPLWELGRFTALRKIDGPQALWRKFTANMVMQDSLRDEIEKELLSSFHWQTMVLEAPPPCPFSYSSPIEWEQSLVAGHPTHPMHRSRTLPYGTPENYDWYHPLIRFVVAPSSSITVAGPFEQQVRSLAEIAANKSGTRLLVDPGKVIMPVHELQVPNVLSKFKDVELLGPEVSIRALGQSSVRTVVIPELPGKALKLAVGVKISSSLRTISHYTADFGPRFSKIVPKLSFDPKILSIELEPASAIYRDVDPSVAKHLTAVLRDEYEPRRGENLIVCAALLETGHAGVPAGISAVEHAFCLDTDEKRTAFLDRYIRLACEALVPPLVHNGVALEAHAQNVLARFDVRTGQLLGFVVRDLGGLRIYPPTLNKSTGVDFEFLPGHCIATDTLEEIYPKFYHTLVHNHLQRLIRVLGMHYDGRGWIMLRQYLGQVIPSNHELRKLWLSEESTTVAGKCLMRMRLQGVYRDMVYNPFPNLIQFRPDTDAREQDKIVRPWALTLPLPTWWRRSWTALLGVLIR